MNLVMIDYGAGNTASVRNAFEKIGVTITLSGDEAVWRKADALVFPGVGSFGSAIKSLGKRTNTLRKLILEDRKPFLGICLGMQLLLERSEESNGEQGLGIVPGTVKRFSSDLPVPQIGWNRVENLDCPLFAGISEFYGYFVNSYYCEPSDNSCVSATSVYGKRFPAAFWMENVFATQFHPEKSGKTGLKILENFIMEVRK